MLFKSILVLALVAVVFGQTPQTSISVSSITPGTLFTGALLPSTEDRSRDVNVNTIAIPFGATNMTITITNTSPSSTCTYLDAYIRDEAPACGTSNSDDLCYDGDYISASITSSGTTETYEIGDYDNLFHFGVNRTVYLAVGKDSTSYNTYTCAYTVLVTFNGGGALCGAGTVGVNDNWGSASDVQGCLPYSDVAVNVQTTFNSAAKLTNFRTQVPLNTGSLRVIANLNSSNIDIYAASYSTPYSSDYHCQVSSSTNSTGNVYLYVLDCPTPRSGDFFITFYNSGVNPVTGSFHIEEDVCTGAFGGYKCQYPVAALPTTFPATITVPAYNSATAYNSGSAFAYYYFDIATSTTSGPTVAITATTTTGNYFYIRRNAYPEYSSNYGYEDSDEYQSATGSGATFTVSAFDQYVPGRMFLGFGCTTSSPCTFTVTSSVTQNTAATTGNNVATQTTGNVGTLTTGVTGEPTTGSATMVAVSAIALFFAALMI